MTPPITLLVAYPKELIRAGLRAMLEKTSIKIVAETDDATSTLALAGKHKPNVLLVAAVIPGGDPFELARNVHTSVPGTKVVMLSGIDNPTYMARAKAAGVSDFLLKDVTAKELVSAIKNAAAGKHAMEARPYAKVVAALTAGPNAATDKAKLTPRESQVLSHVAFGLSNDEIAHSLKISCETVKEHMQKVLGKLGMHDRTHAAVWATKAGLV